MAVLRKRWDRALTLAVHLAKWLAIGDAVAFPRADRNAPTRQRQR